MMTRDGSGKLKGKRNRRVITIDRGVLRGTRSAKGWHVRFFVVDTTLRHVDFSQPQDATKW